MLQEGTTNPYVERMRQKFVGAHEAMVQLGDNLSPDTIEDYAKAENEVVKLASKMLESGAPAKESGKNVIITIDDEEYTVSGDKLKKLLGEDEYNMFFVQPDEDFEADIESFFADDGDPHASRGRGAKDVPPVDEDIYNNPFMGGASGSQPVPIYPNPFAALMSYMMLPFAGMYQQGQAARAGYGGESQYAQGSYGAQGQPSNEDTSDLSKSIADVQKKINAIEAEKKTAKKHLSALVEKMKEAKSDLEEKERELVIASAKAKDAEDLVETTKKETGELKAKLQSCMEEKEELSKKVQSLTDQNGNLQKSKEEALRDASKYRSENERLQRELTQTKKEAESVSERLKDANNRLNDARNNGKKASELESQVGTVRKQVDDLQAENKSLSEELEKSRKEAEKYKKDLHDIEAKNREADTEKEDYYRNVEAENKRLKRLAYEDELTKVKTSVALNEYLSKADSKALVLARVDIRRMKTINEKWGKGAGDNALRYVSKELSKNFGENSVYRIMGDNFIVIQKGTDDNRAMSTLSKIKNNLLEQDIHIAYGVSAGIRCDTMRDLMTACEVALNQMKQESAIEDEHTEAPESKKTPPKKSAKNASKKKNYFDDDDNDSGNDDKKDSDDDDFAVEVSLDDDILNNYNPD